MRDALLGRIRRVTGAGAVMLALMLAAGPAVAQDHHEQADPPPSPREEDVDRMQRRSTAAEETLSPRKTPKKDAGTENGAKAAKPKPPGVESGIPVPRARRAREGVFVVKQAGELLVARTGDVIFIPDRDAPERVSRPMVLLPCQAMARLESAAGLKTDVPTPEHAPRPRAVMTGQIMVYRQREYLLPSVFQIETGPRETAAPKEATKAPAASDEQSGDLHEAGGDEKAPDAAAGDSQDREVESFIRELEDRRTRNRALSRDSAHVAPRETRPAVEQKTPKEGAGESQEPAAKDFPVAEGTIITARKARLVHFTDGGPGVSFDNGANGAPGRRTEAPMALLPCQLSQRIEEVVGTRGDRALIEVSGRVFSYGSRNYLLPTMYQILPPSDIGTLN